MILTYFTIYLGARPLNRLIHKQLLNPLAKYLIEGSIRSGETVHVTTKKTNAGEVLSVARNHPLQSSGVTSSSTTEKSKE
jgi:ATP-dependent Clp protease ATP-binding subunit ClpA